MEEQRLDLSCEIFNPMREQFEVALNTLLHIANKQGKEGEITLKLKVSTITERKFEAGKVCAEWEEPVFRWDITRKIKESSNKTSSTAGHGFALKFDEEGKPYIQEANGQINMFDNKVIGMRR